MQSVEGAEFSCKKRHRVDYHWYVYWLAHYLIEQWPWLDWYMGEQYFWYLNFYYM